MIYLLQQTFWLHQKLITQCVSPGKKIQKRSYPWLNPVQVKASICLLHLGNMEAAKPGIQALLASNVEIMGDLYLEAADALLETGYPEQVPASYNSPYQV